MKKVLIFSFLVIFIVSLISCMKDEKGQLTRVDVQKINPTGTDGDTVMITDNAAIENLTKAFENVKWEPNAEPKMDRRADVRGTFFFKFDENMPERLYDYKIWFHQDSSTATLVSTNEKEGFGELDKESANILKREIMNKLINWDVRNEYSKNGNVLFSIFPDPALTTGKPYGYIISFTETFENYKGKKLSIYAYHKETGERITALEPTIITRPSSGYISINRFTTRFELPQGGLWRLEVLFNEQTYGDVILSVND